MTTVTFDDRTDFSISNFEGLSDIDAGDVDWVMDLEVDADGHVEAATVDVRELIHALKLHAAVERTRFGWR